MYDIMLGGQPVGKVAVAKKGLYYEFECRCDFTGEVMYRIAVKCGENEQFLGIPVPEDGKFVLRTKVPMKKLPTGELSFRAVPKHAELGALFVPIAPEEPFAYLRRLQDAYLQIRDGKVGVVIRHPTQDFPTR